MTSAARLTLLLMMLMAAAPLTFTRQTYATRGIVKTAAQSEMVLTRFQRRGEITITLEPATHIDGEIKVGATVSVRYREEAGHHVATAVSVEQKKTKPLRPAA
jgi:hypothetical protein